MSRDSGYHILEARDHIEQEIQSNKQITLVFARNKLRVMSCLCKLRVNYFSPVSPVPDEMAVDDRR